MADHDSTQQQSADLQRRRDQARAAALQLVAEDPEHVACWDDPGGYFTWWIGTQEALIAHGICPAERFPEGRKRIGPRPHGWVRGDYWRVRRIRGRICEVWVHYDEETTQAREARARDAATRQNTGRGRPAAYESPEGFAAFVERHTAACLTIVRDLVSGEHEREIHGRTTIRYDGATVDKVLASCDHIEQLVQAAIPGWTKEVADERRRAQTLRDDHAFGDFLSRAIAGVRPKR